MAILWIILPGIGIYSRYLMVKDKGMYGLRFQSKYISSPFITISITRKKPDICKTLSKSYAMP
jgi:hypothetical protein